MNAKQFYQKYKNVLRAIDDLETGVYTINLVKREPDNLSSFQVVKHERVRLINNVMYHVEFETAKHLRYQDQCALSPFEDSTNDSVVQPTTFVRQPLDENDPIVQKVQSRFE